MESFVLHEHHVSNFETVDEVLDGWTQVATTSPDVFNKSDLIRVNFKGLSQPSIVEFNALILEEVVLVWIIKYLDSHHDEA